MNKISLVYFATPDIALETFKSLISDELFDVKALVTQPPKPAKRGKKLLTSKIKEEAIKNNILVFEPFKISKDEEIISKLQEMNVDFFVTFAFGQILSQKVLDIPKFETINLHASLLPKYRGANPISECLMNGDKYTGITTMITELELDSGDICLVEKIECPIEMNYMELSDKISSLSPKLVKETLIGLYNKTLTPKKQNSNEATFTKKLDKKDKKINFNLTSKALHDKIRAMAGVNTNHFVYKNKLIQVTKTFYDENLNDETSGKVIGISKNGIKIACKTGTIIIEKVKPEGKNVMSAYDWSLGSKILQGEVIQCNQEE